MQHRLGRRSVGVRPRLGRRACLEVSDEQLAVEPVEPQAHDERAAVLGLCTERVARHFQVSEQRKRLNTLRIPTHGR
jgi:hypothetical protein